MGDTTDSAGDPPGKTQNGEDSTARNHTSALVVTLVLFAAVLAVMLAYPRRVGWVLPVDPISIAQVQVGIDPNLAKWFELAQLPRVGEHLSRRIVEFRENATATGLGPLVFKRPADLARVKGIGEKTVRRITPFVRFPAATKGH
jgi:DNA uptake protein ComE-like DNA-binding protein